LTKTVIDAGADAVLALAPAQVSDTQPYYEALAAAAGHAALLAYHFPAVSMPGIPTSVLPALPIAGLKDSSGDPARLYEEADILAGWIYTGSPNLALLAGSIGCAGAILAIANSHPETALEAFAGDGDAQRRLAAASRRSSQPWPQALKAQVEARFGVSAQSRLG
jgi:4-hydroxy-tetrahydrodipicolinate synthase